MTHKSRSPVGFDDGASKVSSSQQEPSTTSNNPQSKSLSVEAGRRAKLAEAAREYRDIFGWVPLRLQGKSPNCMGKGWQKRTLASPIPEFKDGDNIGVLLGKPSKNLVRLDPDFEAIPEVTGILFPENARTFGRATAPRSGRLVTSDIKTTNFILPKSMAGHPGLPLHDDESSLVVFQILSTGAQTMVPPSVHPATTEEITWQAPPGADVAAVEAPELLRRVGIEAFLMVARQFWPARGTRNEAAMALARILLEALTEAFPDDEDRIAIVDNLVTAVAVAGGDGEESAEGKQRARATLEKIRAGEDTTGMPRLVGLLGLPADAAATFRKWLGTKPPAQRAVGILEWRERRKDGMPLQTMHNARVAITALGIDCSYDTFHHKILFGHHGDAVQHELQAILGEAADHGIIRLRQIISDQFGVDLGDRATRDAVLSLALEHCFDPVRDMLDAAEANWDGTQRLDRMAVDYLNCADTRLNRAIMRKTMIAACRRARSPGVKFDNITVLESPEGWNKSGAWRTLAGDKDFSDMSILGQRGREVQEQLSEIWIHESADLAGMRKAEVESVKAFASRQVDIARPAYGYFVLRQKRHSIEVGTTNSVEYLQSQTGNRRFWPMTVTKMIDLDKLQRDRLQLWGEAAKYESAGESIVLDKELWSVAGEEQEKRRTKDPWEDIVQEFLDEYSAAEHNPNLHQLCKVIYVEGGEERVKSADLLAVVLAVSRDRQTQSHSMRLAAVMKQIGWERPASGKVTIDGKQHRGYSRPAPEGAPHPTSIRPPSDLGDS